MTLAQIDLLVAAEAPRPASEASMRQGSVLDMMALAQMPKAGPRG